MNFLRQSTAVEIAMGPFLDSADGNTIENTLTITQPDVRLKKDGGAWAQKSAAQTLSHEENGWYEVSLSATDTDTVGILLVAIHESGALPVWREFQVIEEAIYDAYFAASATGLLPANVTQFGGAAGTFSGGRPEVNVSHWGGTAVASANVLIDGAITAAKIAADAIGASELAADAATEIATAVWASGTRTLTALGFVLAAADIGTDAIGSAEFAQAAADKIWATATRTLTSNPGLDAAGIRTAIGMATANFDTQIGDLPTNAELSTALASADDATLSAIAALNDITVADILGAVYEGSSTFQEYLQRASAVLYGELSGVGSGTIEFTSPEDGTTVRLSITVDGDGNRTAVDLTP